MERIADGEVVERNCALYRHFDSDGRLLYVGISFSALTRLMQHKVASHWFWQIAVVRIENYPTRAAALAAEREAITAEQPIHNLKRPSRDEVSKAQSFVEESTSCLVRRIVQFNPTYSVDEVANAIGLSAAKVKAMIHSGQIGYVVTGSRTGRWGTRPTFRITGWQLIEFLESWQQSDRIG